MSQYDPAKFWQPGQGGGMIKCQIVPVMGKNGNDYDESKQGRIAVYPGNWPKGMEQNPLMAEVQSKQKGPFGESVHEEMLDGMQVTCTITPDGTPLIHNVYAARGGAEPGTSGDPVSYVGAPKEKG